MLEAIPLNWFSSDFLLKDQEETIANIDISLWREKGVITIDNEEYRVNREGILSSAFILWCDNEIFARAEKPSALSRQIVIEHGELKSTLSPRHVLSRNFVLIGEKGIVGNLSPKSLLSRRMKINFSDTLPIQIKMFVIWLTIILWRRDADF